MKEYKRVRRFGSLFLATVVAILTLSVMVHATQVITTPNAAFFSYSLANGANSAAITPTRNQSVLVMGTQTAQGFRGVGQVTMLHLNMPGTFGPFLEWTGLESPSFSGPGGITSNFSSAPGTHIVFLDFRHLVDIQVQTGDTFVVHNASGVTATGNVTMIW
jgi:hypothetical protein